MEQATLVTFPPSLDCELSRFLANHYRVDHVEERHALIFSSFATLRLGQTILFPLLCTKDYRLSTVRQIVDHFDPLCAPALKLLPDGPERAQVEADWSTFNGTLAFATAVFAYYHLLPHREIMLRPLSEGAPDAEVRAVRSAYPVFAGLLRLLLFLTSSRAASALSSARAVLQGVDERLADGRRYLVGDKLSLSDVAFAVAAAPLLLPPAYGGPLPTFDEMPEAMQTAIVETRQRPAGQFALRIYRDHRADGAKDASPPSRASEANGGNHEMARPV